jgi:hypothetical protein
MFIPGDIHFPKHDPRAMDLMLEAALALKVTHWHLQGDNFEYYALSQYDKDAERMIESGSLEVERDAATPYMKTMLAMVKPGRATIGPGNHDGRRWTAFVNKNPALLGRTWDWPVKEALRGWTVFSDTYWAKAGRLVIEHGHLVRGIEKGGGKYPAAKILANYPGQNTLVGHTHRIDGRTTPTRKDGVKVSHGAWTIGMMGLEGELGGPPDDEHEQGFAVVDFFPLDRGGLGHTVTQGRIIRGRRGGKATLNLFGRTWRA